MKRAKYAGRKPLLWGGLLLLVWAGYEFWVRLDTIRWAVEGVWNLSRGENIPFTRAMGYFDPGMLSLMLFLLCCALLSLMAIAFRNRPIFSVFAIPAVCALAWFYLTRIRTGGLPAVSALDFAQDFKLIPMTLILIGALFNLLHHIVASRRREPEHRRHAPRRAMPHDQ